jgi:glycerol kinase
LKAIGITNYRETIVIWSKSTSYPLCNAIVWMDARTSPVYRSSPFYHSLVLLTHSILSNLLIMLQQYRRLENELSGDRTHFVETCGLPISTYFSAMKLLWLMENVVAMLLLLYKCIAFRYNIILEKSLELFTCDF